MQNHEDGRRKVAGRGSSNFEMALRPPADAPMATMSNGTFFAAGISM
jgi:hypothetical protein